MKSRINKRFLLPLPSLLVLLALSGCTSVSGPRLTPEQMAEFKANLAGVQEAIILGSYQSLKDSIGLIDSMRTSFPDFKDEINSLAIKAALLLALREGELKIVGGIGLSVAENLVSTEPGLVGFRPHLEFVKYAYPPIASEKDEPEEARDSELDTFFEWQKNSIDPLNEKLKTRMRFDEFSAYFLLSLHAEFGYAITNKADFSALRANFADTPLILYKTAVWPEIREEELIQLVSEEPTFAEARYRLGDISLQRGKVLTAEGHFKAALDAIPDSLSILMSLTKVYFVLEEFEACLEINERALTLIPRYRDALLGKAISLSYLGRHDEAIEALNILNEMGMYLMGETNYWLAWNKNRIERYDEAFEHITAAQKYLIGNADVHALAGEIDFARDDLAAAESEFLEALRIQNGAHCDASYYLGRIQSRRENWAESAARFESAAQCQNRVENTIQQKMAEIERSSMPPERKRRHMQRRMSQLKQAQLTQATACYNAAAGYFNAGDRDKALDLALKAAEHPSVKKKAEDLIEKIKGGHL